MPVDPGRPQAASHSRTAQRASGSRSPAAAQGRGRRPSEPTRPQGSQSRARAERPLRASVHPASARRARRPPQQTSEGRRRGKRSSPRSPRCQPLWRPVACRPQSAPADPRPPAPVPHLRRAPAPSSPPGPAVYTGSDVRGRPRPRPRRPLRFPARAHPPPRASWAAAPLNVFLGFPAPAGTL